MQIRSATPVDVPAVLPMVAQICALHEAWDAAKYGFLPHPADRYSRWLVQQATSDRSVFLIVEHDTSEHGTTEGDPAGELIAFLVATIEFSGVPFLVCLFLVCLKGFQAFRLSGFRALQLTTGYYSGWRMETRCNGKLSTHAAVNK